MVANINITHLERTKKVYLYLLVVNDNTFIFFISTTDQQQ